MKKLIPLITLAALLTACSFGKRKYHIRNVTKPQTITLTKKSSQGDIHGYNISVKGNITGEAEMVLLNDKGKPYKTEKLSGPVSFEWGGDWYSNSATINYTPTSVKDGELTIRYEFND